MKVDLIEAKTAKELTTQLNNLISHIKQEYNDEPYLEIMEPSEYGGILWRAFVTYGENKANLTERIDNLEKWSTDINKWTESVNKRLDAAIQEVKDVIKGSKETKKHVR